MIYRRITATFVPIPLILLGAWISGFDFDTRGIGSFLLYWMCIVYVGWQWFAPWWKDKI
jgi:hypothetical protein